MSDGIHSMSQSVWTKDNVVNSPYNDVEIPNVTIPEYIWRDLDKWAEKPAMVCGNTNRSFSYNQLYEYSLNFAVMLRTRFQIKDGDVVGLMMPNAIEFPIAVIGALQAGAVVSTINPIHKASEVYRQLLLARPKLIVIAAETFAVVEEAIQMTKNEIDIIIVENSDESIKNLPDETIFFKDIINDDKINKNVLNDVMRKPNDVVFLLYSSGTTGLPKGVELTNRNIVANFAQQEAEGLRHYVKATDQYQDSILAVLPFYHVYGLTVVLLHKLIFGAKIVVLPKFQPATFANALKNHNVNLLYVVPSLASFLVTHPEAKKEHLASVDRLVCGAAPIAKSDLRRVLEKCQPGLKFIILYGLTEASPVVTGTVPGSREHCSTVGFALPNTQLRVLDSNERNLGPGEIGELYIRGPQVMKGYRDNPEATKAAITDDGWFRSGDLVSINSDGAVIIVDRIKELIKVKGYQVAPAELEHILKEHPDVKDAAVVGIPDAKKGEVPKAFVVLKKEHSTTANIIKEYVNRKVSEYKNISEVVFIDVLPRDLAGKLQRRALKDNK